MILLRYNNYVLITDFDCTVAKSSANGLEVLGSHLSSGSYLE